MNATYFAVCAPGIEPFLHAEAKELGLSKLERQVGGVRFIGRREDAWKANLHLRTAVRVLERLERTEALDEHALYGAVRRIDWTRFLNPGGTLRVDAQVKESSMTHSRFVEQRTKDAVVDQLRETWGERPSVDKDSPDLRVHAHLFRDRLTLSVDTSGDSLHKRGWRKTQGRAPLAENLAAALVLASGWNRRAPLIDPFCGSGTVLIEAAHLAMNRAPGLDRDFAFQGWPGHEEKGYGKLVAAARKAVKPLGKTRLVGRDVDPERVEDTRSNLVAVGLEEAVELAVENVVDFEPRKGWNAWIVTNPPYGERVGEVRELERVYRTLGATLREGAAGYELTLLSGNPALAKAMGLKFDGRHEVRNGGLECEILHASLHG